MICDCKKNSMVNQSEVIISMILTATCDAMAI